jgi:hypothetical protein
MRLSRQFKGGKPESSPARTRADSLPGLLPRGEEADQLVGCKLPLDRKVETAEKLQAQQQRTTTIINNKEQQSLIDKKLRPE